MTSRFQQKLAIPTAAHPLVERAALLERLDQTINAKNVVALAAPAGWGKTTALAQWVAYSTLPVAWYTLDSGDRDPRLFLDYLLHAVRPLIPDAADLIAQLTVASPRALPDLFHEVALAIAAAPEPFALILDDFHLLEEEAPAALPSTALIFTLLMSLIDYAPNCRLVLASRALPDLHGMVRVIAQQRAALFDYNALQFSPADVQRLAGTMAGVLLSDAGAEQLTNQLGGWVTGLVLSLDQAVQTHDQPALAIEADTTPVYAFFAEQTIAPLPPRLQRFLEETSALDNLSPQHCNALRGTRDAARMLDEVARRCLFVARRGGWLVYHSLFREFLRARLAQDPARERRLLRRAGDLYREEDDVDRAIACYLAGQDLDAAIEVLRAAVPRLRQRSLQTTLLASFERINAYCKHDVQGRWLPPDLLLAQARIYRDLALWEDAYALLQLAGAIGAEEISWEARIIEADMLQLQGDHARALVALADLPVATLPPRIRLLYQLTIGRTQVLSGAIDAAILSLEQAQSLAPRVAETAADPSLLASIADNLGWAYMTQGNRSLALRQLKRADAYWQANGNSGRRAVTLNNLGTLALEEGRYAEARRALETSLTLAQQTARRREEIMARYSLAELDIAEGQLDRALSGFTEVYALAVQTDVSLWSGAAAIGALWAAALHGDQATAQHWQQVVADLPPPPQREVQGRRALAQGLLLLQQPSADRTALASLVEQATGVEGSLQPPERAYLALLRATLIFMHAGGVAAWAAFETQAKQLPEALVQCFVPAHEELLIRASASSPLARRLLESRRSVATRWKITALGRFDCQVDGVSCTLSPLHRTLLVRLLDAGPQGLPIERLWEAVWGESDLSMAALHQALRRLRMYAHLDVVVRDGFCNILSAWDAIDYDVRKLEDLLGTPLSHESMRQAVTLYGGEFLPSAPLGASVWADARRAYLQQRYLAALEQFARAVEAEAPDQAIDCYQHIMQIDGCREQTAIHLMHLAARFGNRSLVTATFDHLTRALHTLGATPASTTSELYRQLR